ncbi:uncharacterized protein [Asterias amurensis]|uniref:uncharacterized protein isoform X1 n=2 Tax=Asterias amurensis TaxID=7602 RepID=UPI003AB7FBCE
MNTGGTAAPLSPYKKPTIAPKPSSLKSPPLPLKKNHGSPKKAVPPLPTPKPRKLQTTRSTPVPLSPKPPMVKAKSFQSPGQRENSEDSGVFDLRDSAEFSKVTEVIDVKEPISEESTIEDEAKNNLCNEEEGRVPPADAAPAAVAVTSSLRGSPPKPLPRRAPPSPVPPPRRAKSVVDPPSLNRELKPKLTRSTDDLTSCAVEEEDEPPSNDFNHSTDSLSDQADVQVNITGPPQTETDSLNTDRDPSPPPIPPHKQSNSPKKLPLGNFEGKPSRPPPPTRPAPSAPPIRPKPTGRKIQSQLIPESHSVLQMRKESLMSDGSRESSPTIPPRTRRSLSLTVEEVLRSNHIEKSFSFDETMSERDITGHERNTNSNSEVSQMVDEGEHRAAPPRKRWSQHSHSATSAIPYHKVQCSSPFSSTNDLSILSSDSSGIIGYHSVAPPRPSQGPPKRTPPPPPAPFATTKASRSTPSSAEKRTPPPRPPPMRSALPPKPATLVQSVSQEDSINSQGMMCKNHRELSHVQSDAGCSRNSMMSEDDEYVLPDSPYYENNEFTTVFDPLSPAQTSESATKRPVPGRKRAPPPKPSRTLSILSDISNDGYEDMSRGSLASVALSSIGAEVYSVPRSCEHSMHESGRCQCADYAEQSSGEEEGSISDDDEDSYEKFDQDILVEKEDEEEEDDVEPEVRKRRKAFLVAQELRDSEKVFVDVLKLINEDFKVAIDDAEKAAGRPIIEKGTLDQILGHLPQLQMFNEDLLSDLDSRINNWAETPHIADIFLKKGPYLKLYNTYIRDFQKLTAALEEASVKSPLFQTALKEFEASPRCQNLSVRQHMLKPIQRIPQYKLLLTEYLKQLDEVSQEADYKDTEAALNIVSEVANHVNESMKQGDNLDKLLQLQHSLVGNHEIVKPGRVFIKEGDLLKLSRKVPQTRRFYLLSDILLYTTPFLLTPGQYSYKLHNVLSLAGMRVSKPAQEDYKNEFSIISVQRSFTLAASTPQERDSWITALNKAITDYASKRSSFAMLHPYAQLLTEGDTTSLGRKAPAWIPDGRVTMCMICTCEFTITWRRHHCRACGKVICGHCSSNKIPLLYLTNKVARVCDQCFKNLGKGDKQGEESEDKDRGKGKSKRKRSTRLVIRPSALKQVSANEQDTTMSGYLMLRRKKDWKRQWYVLKEKVLYRYKASEDVAALESMPLLGYDVTNPTEPFDGVDPSLILQLSHQLKVMFILRAENKAVAEKWSDLMVDATHL